MSEAKYWEEQCIAAEWRGDIWQTEAERLRPKVRKLESQLAIATEALEEIAEMPCDYFEHTTAREALAKLKPEPIMHVRV